MPLTRPAIYNRERETGPLYSVHGGVDIEDLRIQVWRGYSRSERVGALKALDRALRHVEVFARKGAVVRGKGEMESLDQFFGLKYPNTKLESTVDKNGLVVMRAHELNDGFRLGLTTLKGYHPKTWMAIAGPDLVSGLTVDLINGNLEIGFREEPNFDRAVDGLAQHTMKIFDAGLPLRVRHPYYGHEVVKVRLNDLHKKYGSAEN